MSRATRAAPGQRPGRLAGKVALITGGESGIGLATARVFVAEGAHVLVSGIDREALARAGDELGPTALVAVADVTDEGAVAAAVARTLEAFGSLDVVFSNAGVAGPIGPLTACSVEAFRRVLDVHVVGAFIVLKHALPVLSDGGSVVINSSVVGLTADPGIAPYATAKHAQVGLMRVAAKEVAARGIRVTTIHPGPTSTPFQADVEQRATGLEPAAAADAFDQAIPLGRHASPEEVARLVLFLAGDESRFLTGATVALDGGMSI
ncbi:SDR family NAD(P)-dependent oxidoreductase [Cellulomonas sp. KRMCY2]|uniref:SDR family NAD(P)-dependent oxidoreductase n=1 Tax=Cellulomonas sp. KRMCY2 TaxID=1304865 RepID=UPI00045EA118|nr:SDR family NAD(P)-dependent oxidoreductase [Cellulomonas sp. KRMCY2]